MHLVGWTGNYRVDICNHCCSRYPILQKYSFFPEKKRGDIFPTCLAPPTSTSQHGCERTVYRYHSEGMDQAAGSPTCQSVGVGDFPYSHSFCCHLPLHGHDLLHPLLLLRKAKVPGLQSSASAGGLKTRQRQCSYNK